MYAALVLRNGIANALQGGPNVSRAPRLCRAGRQPLSEASFADPLDQTNQPINIHSRGIGHPAIDLIASSPAQRQLRFEDLAHAAREPRGEEFWFECVPVDENAMPLTTPKDCGVSEIVIGGARLDNL